MAGVAHGRGKAQTAGDNGGTGLCNKENPAADRDTGGSSRPLLSRFSRYDEGARERERD